MVVITTGVETDVRFPLCPFESGQGFGPGMIELYYGFKVTASLLYVRNGYGYL